MYLGIKKAYVFSVFIYLLALPLGAMHIGAVGSALRIIAILPVFFAIANLKKLYISKPIIYYMLYILICGLSVLYSTDMVAAKSKFISMLLLFLLLLSSCFFKYSDKDLDLFKRALVWSSRISCLLCLIFNNYVQGRMYFQSGAFSEDPNYFCAYLSFGVINALEIMLRNGASLKSKILSLIELSVYLTVALLTGSRGGLLALLFGIAMFILFSNRKVLSIKTIMIISLVSISLYLGTQFLSDDILSRFTVENVSETGGTGRTIIWAKALKMFGMSDIFRKLFGQGLGNTVNSWVKYGFKEAHVCHNMFIESLIEIGLIGLITYISGVCSFIQEAFKRDRYAFAVVVVMFFLSLSTSISTFKPYINIMLYILCLANIDYTKRTCY